MAVIRGKDEVAHIIAAEIPRSKQAQRWDGRRRIRRVGGTGRTARACRPGCADRAGCASVACGTGQASSSRGPRRAGCARGSDRTGCTGGADRTSGTDWAGRTGGAGSPIRPRGACRTSSPVGPCRTGGPDRPRRTCCARRAGGSEGRGDDCRRETGDLTHGGAEWNEIAVLVDKKNVPGGARLAKDVAGEPSEHDGFGEVGAVLICLERRRVLGVDRLAEQSRIAAAGDTVDRLQVDVDRFLIGTYLVAGNGDDRRRGRPGVD